MARALPLLCLVAVFVGCGSSEPKLTTAGLERQLREQIGRDLEQANSTAVSLQESTTLEDLSCVRQSPSKAVCHASLSGPVDAWGMPTSGVVDIEVAIDPATGRFQWRRVDGDG